MSADKAEVIIIGGGLLVAGYFAYRMLKAAPAVARGALTGNNALTRGATNLDGSKQSAYVGAGPLGTLGAGANALSLGAFSSFGDWIGTSAGNLFQTDPMAAINGPLNAAPASTPAAVDKYQQGGNAASGSGSLDLFADPSGFGYNWGG